MGSIDGGTGTDTVVCLDDELSSSQLSFENVEILDLTNVSSLSAGMAQVTAFSTILVDSSLTEFSFELIGPLVEPVDFSTRFISSVLLHVDAMAAVSLIGTNNADELKGGSTDNISDPWHFQIYGSVLAGGGGNDRLIGASGSDYLAGGSGADYMEGRGGGDTFDVDNLGILSLPALRAVTRPPPGTTAYTPVSQST